MARRSDDFEFFSSVLDRFFKGKSIRGKLSAIKSLGINDFEKWIQVELEIFLIAEDSVSGFEREYSYPLDGRRAAKAHCRVDLVVKQKHKQTWVVVEIKQVHSPLTCFRGMVSDYKKLCTIRKSANDIRCMVFFGIHHIAEHREEILVGLMKNVIEEETDSGYEFLVNEPIGETGFAYSLVGIS